MSPQPQSYPFSPALPPPIQDALRIVWDRLHALQGRGTDPSKFTTDLHLGGHKIQALADPASAQDAVTKAYADTHYGADAHQINLSIAGQTPLNVTGLVGVLREPQKMGIRVVADTDSLPDTTTSLDYEVVTWKGQLYYFDPTTNPGKWILLSAAASLTTGTHSARVALTATAQSLGLLFWETDRLSMYAIVLSSGVKVWKFLFGRMIGTISPNQKPGDLGTNDADFSFFSTDYARPYRWTGAAWVDGDGAPSRYQIAFFDATPEPSAGWLLCDGTAGNRSKSDGTTTAYTPPDLITNNVFLRAANASGGTGGAATHTHSVDPPSTTSNQNSLEIKVQKWDGTGGNDTTVAASPHTHDTDIAAFTSASASTLPPYYQAKPYIRV